MPQLITSITGELKRVLEEEVRLTIGPMEYQVMVPDLVRRAVQQSIGQTVSFHTIQYLEGNPARGGRMVPRLMGFLSELQIEFFELFCTVDGVGFRTALKAFVRPVRDMAQMIQDKDTKMLATLPGISSNLAERVVAKLRTKMTKFSLLIEKLSPASADGVEQNVIEEAFLALLSMGHSEADARNEIDKVLQSGEKFTEPQEIVKQVYLKKGT